MKTNNKGYSLVELVMTLGCFSIIMLAIMLMMRTTIATYKDGLLEARKQQEAQIVANQVADLIVDAKSYAGQNGAGTSYAFYTVEDPSTPKYFVLDESTNTLYFDRLDAINGGFGTPISDCVKEFKIEGLRSSAIDKLAPGTGMIGAKGYTDDQVKATEYDNTCRVRIKIDYLGREYEAVKDVHFRNEIENPDQYDVSQDASVGGGSTPTPSGEKEICVLRYDTIDLTKKYGIVSVESPSSSLASFYVVDSLTLDQSTHGITVKCNGTLNSDIDHANTKPSKCTIVGKDKEGHATTFLFYTEPFSFDVGSKPIFMDYYEVTQNGGFHQDLPIKGIHVNEMLKAGKSIKYTLEFKSNGSSRKISDMQTLSKNTANDNGQANLELQFDGMRLKLGLIPNAFSNGFVISTGNEAHNQDATGKKYKTNDGKQELVFSIYFEGETTPKTITYKYYMVGSTLEHAGD